MKLIFNWFIFLCTFLKDTIRYSINTESVQRDLNSGPATYFYVDTESGIIGLRKSLLGTSIRELLVSLLQNPLSQNNQNSVFIQLVLVTVFDSNSVFTKCTKNVINVSEIITLTNLVLLTFFLSSFDFYNHIQRLWNYRHTHINVNCSHFITCLPSSMILHVQYKLLFISAGDYCLWWWHSAVVSWY